jgi:cytochrome P450
VHTTAADPDEFSSARECPGMTTISGVSVGHVYVPPMPPMAPNAQTGLQLMRALRRNALQAFPVRCLEEPVVRFSALGRTLVVASAPEAIRHIMHAHDEDYGHMPIRRRVLGPIIGRGLVNSEGSAWRVQRRTLAPAFTPRSIPPFARHVMQCAEAACLRLETNSAKPVDLQSELGMLSLEIVAASMFSLEVATFGPDLRKMLALYAETLGKPSVADYILPVGIPTIVGVRRSLFRRRWVRLIRSILLERRSVSVTEDPLDLFDLLAKVYGEEADDLLIDEASTMLIAGHETAALTMFWAFALVARAPDWQAAIAEEARRVDLSPENCALALTALPITQAVLQETLRLYSPAFMMVRLAKRTHRVCGVQIPAGALVLMPIWLMHRNPAFWTAPDAFDPSRFLSGRKPERFTFLPFGAGPRTCIGAQLAMTEAALVLARLIRQFDVTVVDNRPILPVAVLTTRPDRTVSFLLQRRI